jgi:hypothetical protein
VSTAVAPPPIEQRAAPEAPVRQVVPELPAPRRTRAGIVGGLILIALGVAALAGNLLPTPGGVLFIGLGSAFLVARVLTGRYGYAVPAGVLLAFGAFVSLTESRLVVGREAGGLFFIILGLGFVASYVIAARPRQVWPIVPASILIGFGLFVQGWLLAWPFEQLVWLAPYWPLALIVFGMWLLLRDRMPVGFRAPMTIAGLGVLILVGFLVAAAGMATVAPASGRFVPFPAWPMMPLFGGPQIQDTVVLSAPLAPGEILRLSNTSGRTTLRAGASQQVRVEAVRHYWPEPGPPQVGLRPSPGALIVEVTQNVRDPGAGAAYVDYLIDVPSAAGADVGSTSGDLSVSGLSGPVTARTTSGDITLTDLDGPVTVETASGSVHGTGVTRIVQARSFSGTLDLAGTFTGDATVVTTSGDVTLRFEPGTSARIDASTISGMVRSSGPGMPSAVRDGRSRSVVLGSGAVPIQVRTTSGSITLLSR